SASAIGWGPAPSRSWGAPLVPLAGRSRSPAPAARWVPGVGSERLEGGGDGGRRRRLPGQGLDRLQTVAGDHGDHPLVRANRPGRRQLGEGGDGDATG